MNVPRGTKLNAPRVWCLRVPERIQRDVRRKASQMRVPLMASNCIVTPGTFERLDLETGRARSLTVPQLRARCEFPNGKPRAVTVMTAYAAGDVVWLCVPFNRSRTRAGSRVTLEVTGVRVGRVQDMDDYAALAEGVWGRKREPIAENLTPRDVFAERWEEWQGPHAWRANAWVWILDYRVHSVNVDKFLQGASA